MSWSASKFEERATLSGLSHVLAPERCEGGSAVEKENFLTLLKSVEGK
jgi:hypothetical protein